MAQTANLWAAPTVAVRCADSFSSSFPPLPHFSLFVKGVREADSLFVFHLQVSVTRSGTARSSKRTSGGRWPGLAAVATAVVAGTECAHSRGRSTFRHVFQSYSSHSNKDARWQEDSVRKAERSGGRTCCAERGRLPGGFDLPTAPTRPTGSYTTLVAYSALMADWS